ncbi:hypothetical protein [Corynebacterium kroppenstedtii]|uniref:hypothetical protein n=1 Tax=Corynebacterium kroppenstedtii TaxID=161879 RepID=UPI00195F0A77|nr:hypothetical protein [Corynebacterium kroppenstedtii]QRQ65176.1 hypothetical protein I6J23_01380 [Corynebacterium kroppenstedtii]
MRKALREGRNYDKKLFAQFMLQQTRLIKAIEPIIKDELSSSILVEARGNEEVEPNSNRYRYSSRLKTSRTLIEKLRRMDTTPINRIQDIAGLRIDFDGTLEMQDAVARQLERAMKASGAKKTRILDMRSEPHNGYRAVHIHVDFPAGKAEIQIRTPLQAIWANAYETAADIFGRQIRYRGGCECLGKREQEIVYALHDVSDKIRHIELSQQEVRSRHRKDNKPGAIAPPVTENNLKIEKVYAIIGDILEALKDIRNNLETSLPSLDEQKG